MRNIDPTLATDLDPGELGYRTSLGPYVSLQHVLVKFEKNDLHAALAP